MKKSIMFACLLLIVSSSFCQVVTSDGYVMIKYRGKPASLICADLSFDPITGNLNYTGRVDICEGNDGQKGRLLSQATYYLGKREGKAWELDYDNDLQHYLYYHNGVLSDTNKIRTMSDKKLIAYNVSYKKDSTDFFINNIESGYFMFDGGPSKFLISNVTQATVAWFKNDYKTYNPFDYSIENGKTRRKTSGEINAMNQMFSRSNGGSSGNSTLQSINNHRGLSPMQMKYPNDKHWDEVAKEGVAKIDKFIPTVETFKREVAELIEKAKNKRLDKEFVKTRIQEKRRYLLDEMDRLASALSDYVPAGLISEFMLLRQWVSENYRISN